MSVFACIAGRVMAIGEFLTTTVKSVPVTDSYFPDFNRPQNEVKMLPVAKQPNRSQNKF